MRTFIRSAHREARDFALAGGQAVHVWSPKGSRFAEDAPACFKRAATWAHLLDQDRDRLVATAKRLGVCDIVIHAEGKSCQHVDLCGRPLARAIEESE